MLDIFEAYATDETAEVNGTWQQLNGADFLVARAGNRNYAKKLTDLVERNQKALDRKDEAADKLSDQIMIDVLAETILLGWKNVSFKGKELPYSVANAKTLLAVKDFRREVLKMADDVAQFRAKLEEEQAKN
jgi:hypothetical protein